MSTPRDVRATNRTPIAAGSFTRYVASEDPFQDRVMAFRNDDSSQLSESDKLTAEQVKEVALLAEREDIAKQHLATNQQTGDGFIQAHPEYVDTKANAELMRHEMDRMFGPGLHPVAHFESAFESLKASNFLTLDGKVIARQQKAAAAVRYATERAQSVPPSEQELYDMPLEDLRRLDAMQHAGESR